MTTAYTPLNIAVRDMTSNSWWISVTGDLPRDIVERRYSDQHEFWINSLSPNDRDTFRDAFPSTYEAFKNRDAQPEEPLADWEKELLEPSAEAADLVNHPPHYTNDPSGVECIEVTRHRNFNIGNAIKYLWRAGRKDGESLDPVDKQIQDLEKAVWYIQDEIKRIRGLAD